MAQGKEIISMKLLIDKNNNKVLFAEAGKECADFFFYLLALPIGTVVKCLTKKAMVGSVGNLYESLENLSHDYLQADVSKDYLLNPSVGSITPQSPLLMSNHAPNSETKKFYACSKKGPHCCGPGCECHYAIYCSYVCDGEGAICPKCGSAISRDVTYVAPPGKETKAMGSGGYVKGVVTYMIMDDLGISPMSTISSIALLNKFNVKDVGRLEEKTVSLDMNQGLALLKASLKSTTVLTDVFLGNKGV